MYLYMHLLVLFLMTNHQCMVMNNLKLIDWFCKCNIYSQIMNKVYIRYPNHKRHQTLTSSSLPLIFASWCLHDKNPAVASQHIWHPFSTVTLFHSGNVPMKPSLSSLNTAPIFSGKKFQMGMQKMKFQ